MKSNPPLPAQHSHFGASNEVQPNRLLINVLCLQLGSAFCIIYVTHRFRLAEPWIDALRMTGFSGLAAASLSISSTGLIATLLLQLGRRHEINDRPSLPKRRYFQSLRRRSGVTVAWLSGWPQATIISLGATVTLSIIWFGRPSSTAADAYNAIGSYPAILVAVLAFLCLLCERFIVARSSVARPEGLALTALLRLPLVMMTAIGCLILLTHLGVAIPSWSVKLLDVLAALVAGELFLRTLGIWFAPPPAIAPSHAAIDSYICRLLMPEKLSTANFKRGMEDKFGIDLSRSWALSFVSAAALPVLLSLLVTAWLFSGVRQIGENERGSYERFGAPVAILGPGLHFLPPWPIGSLKRLDYGVIHTVLIGYEDAPTADPGASLDQSTADGDPPTSANRLWDEERGTDASFITASKSIDRQSFGTISVNLRVLYQIGNDDESAIDALYKHQDLDGLTRTFSGRVLAHFFAQHTLDELLETDRASVANNLKTRLQQELENVRSGVKVLTVIVEAIHPPTGAASAYREVQAAEINARTAAAQERGHAIAQLSVTRRDAVDIIDQAQALSAEIFSAATIRAEQSHADRLAYQAAGPAFLMERYFSGLRSLSGTPLQIVDDRLVGLAAPLLDLRSSATQAFNPESNPSMDEVRR